MTPKLYNLTKFFGINTHLMTAEGGELFAQDIKNLRVNRWGQLTAQVPVKDAITNVAWHAPDGESVKGIGTESDNIYFLWSNGRLFFGEGPTFIELVDIENLTGRLSIQSLNKLVFFTSEGSDAAYQFDKTLPPGLGNRLSASTLSVQAPASGAAVSFDSSAVTPIPVGEVDDALDLTGDQRFFYKITYADASGNSLEADDPAYVTIESPPSDRISASITYTNPSKTHINVPIISGIPAPTDTRIKWIFVYRSLGFHEITTPDSEVQYYRAMRIEVESGETSYSVNDANFAKERDIRYPLGDLAVFPKGKTLTLYNDRLWTTVESGLRSSDVRDGIPIWSNWPKAEIIPTQTKPIFCGTVNRYLIFGGPNELWSLIGTSRYDYQINRIGSRGPVSPYAWGNISNAIGFVGTDGFYVTDGLTVQKISEPLDGFFDSEPNTDGLVVDVPQGTIWGTQDKAFIADKQWTRLDTESPILQATLQTDGSMLFTDGGAIPETWDGLIIEADTPTASWLYKSQEFDANTQRDKSFKWFEVTGTADNDITITIYVDREQVDQFTLALDGDERIGINCWGQRIQFEITGTGEVEIEGVRLYYFVSQRK